jgi:thiol-disulfide isomerase/thioredoxin
VAPPPGAVSTATSAPNVEVLSWDQTQKRREEFLGKVVVLDVWSTYCDPCVREFPNLVALQKQFGDKIRCISFDTDYSGAVREPPESFRKPVLEFLTKRGASGLLNVISSDPSEDFFNKIHLGGPPAVFVYDQNGKLVKRFDNGQAPKVPELTYQHDIVPLVEKLLRK